MKGRDYALALGPDGVPLLHAADCPEVRAQAEAGDYVMTMWDCARDARDLDVALHDCLCLEAPRAGNGSANGASNGGARG